jgi:NAD(P)-binding Rossmann-like domain
VTGILTVGDTLRGVPTTSESSVDAIVLGAGISGLVSASILVEQGAARVLVVDSYDHVGGNHIDRACDGYTFDVGSFIFQDDSPLLRHLPELLPLYVPIDPSWAKLTPQGVITRYPFSVPDDFIAAGPLEWLRMLGSAAAARIRRRRMRNARDFARYWIGARLLHRSGLEHYMERFCGLPAEKIDLKFAEKRMMWIAEYARLSQVRRLIRPPADTPATRVNTQLARPREGFAHLYAPAVERLERDGVTFLLGADTRRLTKVPDGYELEVGEQRVTAPRVVSTIPIDMAQDLCGIVPEKRLPTVTLISLFFSFSGRRGYDRSILYNFSHDGAWKRLTTYSDFYGPHDGREFFAVEVIADQVHGSVEYAEKDFRAHTAANGLFSGDLRLEGSHVLEHAYPIYTDGAGDRAETAIANLRAFGLESFGRQGGFQYQPTARVSTVEAESALTR